MEEVKELKVVTLKDVMETLHLLIDKYKFNIDALSKLLGIEKDVILSKDEKSYSRTLRILVRCLT